MAKILIVDDSEATRAQARIALEAVGHQVLEAEDGFQGIARVQSHPDLKLLLCDINLPQMDGITLCRKLRELPEGQSLAILMLTTESSPEMKKAAKELGVLAWITKPLVSARLVAGVEKILSR